jgi:signal transduction histidine kinase
MRDFLANVSHELRTPLTSIRGFSQAVAEGAVDDPDGVKRSAQVVNQESARLLRLVEELLDLSRVESGQAEMRLAPVELGELLDHLREVFSLRAEDGNVRFEVSAPAELTVQADLDRLEQVLSNLLDNAFKHTPAGGRVVLAATAVPGAARIDVSDSGAGIPEAEMGRLFERFYRTPSSQGLRGSGLGLAIAREIARAHGGDITVQNRPGDGTTFSVRLPTEGRRSPPSAAR